jgi:transcriptional regulator with XRE-family HTH domain|nr:helix-turn-helix transcriptional regulator [Enhydrobacter aerosaccus]
MNENQRIGERLEAERKRLGYTAIEVYNSLDIAQTTYKGYETGKRDISAGLLAQLWDMGFDVLYIVTGVYAESASTNDRVIQHRLVRLPENTDTNVLSDSLLVAMYHAEEALIQAGAVAEKDYNYQDLLMAASTMQQKRTK